MKSSNNQKSLYRFIKLFVFAEVLCIVCIVSFLAGRRITAKEYQQQLMVMAKEFESEKNELTAEGSNKGNNANTSEDKNNAEDKKSGTDEDADVNLAQNPLLILVNKNNPLPEDYEVTLKKLPDGTNRASQEAYQPLCDMLNAGRREGLNFEICSSYRSVERQKELFYEDLEALIRRGYSYEKAYQEVAKETMPPGHSEHSTGLAFDIVSLDYQMLDANQANTPESKWLKEHCAEFGFILRYPEGKEEITHISFESWHFRYVGMEAAEYIMEHEITLEEYLETL